METDPGIVSVIEIHRQLGHLAAFLVTTAVILDSVSSEKTAI